MNTEKAPFEITEMTSTTNLEHLPGRKVEFIVIHYTASVTSKKGTAAAIATWFDKETTKVSSDFIIDDETIVQLNTDIENMYCHHCGGDKGDEPGGSAFHGICRNDNSIGIEVCSHNSTGKMMRANDPTWGYTDAVLDNAVKLVRFLMKKYEIPPVRVIRHFDVSGKRCPGIIGWNPLTGSEAKWFAFQKRISD